MAYTNTKFPESVMKYFWKGDIEDFEKAKKEYLESSKPIEYTAIGDEVVVTPFTIDGLYLLYSNNKNLNTQDYYKSGGILNYLKIFK